MTLHLPGGETFLFHWKFRSQHLHLRHLCPADPVSLGHASPGLGSIELMLVITCICIHLQPPVLLRCATLFNSHSISEVVFFYDDYLMRF